MPEQIRWIEGPWPGKLAISSRPRGGDWLADEIRLWRSAGVNTVLSLLTSEEEDSLELLEEGKTVRAQGMTFLSFPIRDRQVPDSETELAAVLEKLRRDLSAGHNVLVHCRQGIGRTGMVAACLLAPHGGGVKKVLEKLSLLRGVPVPETPEQQQWIEHYAETLAHTK